MSLEANVKYLNNENPVQSISITPPSDSNLDSNTNSILNNSNLNVNTNSSSNDSNLNLNANTINSKSSPSSVPSISSLSSTFGTRLLSRFDSNPKYLTKSPSNSSFSLNKSRSRSSSLSSFNSFNNNDSNNSSPWDVIRWNLLKKISNDIFSDNSLALFGSPTTIAVTITLAVGTSKGYILLFDYHQTLRYVFGPNSLASQAGPVTALAISSDYEAIASGHSSGSIFIWDITKAPTYSTSSSLTKSFKPQQNTYLNPSLNSSSNSATNLHRLPSIKYPHPLLHIPPIEYDPCKPVSNDGHIIGASILHISFLGKRHTALVSSDNRGMAFSHDGTRSLTGRVVQTLRLIGRYSSAILSDNSIPAQKITSLKPPSIILDFAALPLGNITHFSDSVGLVAAITSKSLVIISIFPQPKTEFKLDRRILPHYQNLTKNNIISASLAWYPAMKHDNKINAPLLAYCWGNTLQILYVTTYTDKRDMNESSSLFFSSVSSTLSGDGEISFKLLTDQWKCVENVSTMKWVNYSTLILLTVTQRVVILNTITMSVLDTIDLISKQIIHHNYFSIQAHLLHLYENHSKNNLVENSSTNHSFFPNTEFSSNITNNDDNESLKISDVFSSSFCVFKERVFLLNSHNLSIGTFSNWADRLLAIMDKGRCIDAIILATQYYLGQNESPIIGLPSNSEARQSLLSDKLIEIIIASLKYTFNLIRNENSQQNDNEIVEKDSIIDLTEVIFDACIALNNYDFLFEEIFDLYDANNFAKTYYLILAQYINCNKISHISAPIMKGLILEYSKAGMTEDLEDIICQLDTTTMDIDQTLNLCKLNDLYEALTYIWNIALNDYITPLSYFIELINSYSLLVETANLSKIENSRKIFTYLAYVFTGRIYPTGGNLSENKSLEAKSQLYYFLFAGSIVSWPENNGIPIYTEHKEKSFPYVRTLLEFDPSLFFSAFDEAFEDSFLNNTSTNDDNNKNDNYNTSNNPEEVDKPIILFGKMITRQYIIQTLFEIIKDDDWSFLTHTYFNMFVARNLAKYSQFLILSDSVLQNILSGLCINPNQKISDKNGNFLNNFGEGEFKQLKCDCQLSIEYLLSSYHPPSLDTWIARFIEIKYYDVLKYVYRSERQFDKLLDIYLNYSDDETESNEIFSCISDCFQYLLKLDSLFPTSSFNFNDIHNLIIGHLSSLISRNAQETLYIAKKFDHKIFEAVYELKDDSLAQYKFINVLLTSDNPDKFQYITHTTYEIYITLLCKYKPESAIPFIKELPAKIQLETDVVKKTLIDNGFEEGLAFLLNRNKKYLKAIELLTGTINSVSDLVENENFESINQTRIEANINLSILTCISASHCAVELSYSTVTLEDMWLDLIESVVRLMIFISYKLKNYKLNNNDNDNAHKQALKDENWHTDNESGEGNKEKNEVLTFFLSSLRKQVQKVFSSLLIIASPTNEQQPLVSAKKNLQEADQNEQLRPSLYNIIKRFLDSVNKWMLTGDCMDKKTNDEKLLTKSNKLPPSISDIRNILLMVFESYKYRKLISSLVDKFSKQSIYPKLEELHSMRTLGWRPINMNRTNELNPRYSTFDSIKSNSLKKEKNKELPRFFSNKGACEICGRQVWGKGVSEYGVDIYESWELANIKKFKEKIKRTQLQAEIKRFGHPVDSNKIVQDNDFFSDKTERKLKEKSLVIFRCHHVYHSLCLKYSCGIKTNFYCILCKSENTTSLSSNA